MKKLCYSLFILFTYLSFSQSHDNNKANYELAYKFSPKNLAKLVHSTTVNPHWLKNGNKFWYQYKTTNGSKYYLVDADRRTKSELFDNDKMAAWLTEITKDPYDGKHLPKFNFKFVKNETAIRFRVTSSELVESSDTLKKKSKEKKVFFLEYKLGGNGLTIINNEKKKDEKWKKWANVAPDSTIVLYSKKHNLYWMDKENFLKAVADEKDSTIVENQWTKDGVEHFGYGGYNRGMDNEDIEKMKNDKFPIRGYWSSDSKNFVYQKTDRRKIKDLWVINSVGKKRPTLETYKYHMAGEEAEYTHEILIFDRNT